MNRGDNIRKAERQFKKRKGRIECARHRSEGFPFPVLQQQTFFDHFPNHGNARMGNASKQTLLVEQTRSGLKPGLIDGGAQRETAPAPWILNPLQPEIAIVQKNGENL